MNPYKAAKNPNPTTFANGFWRTCFSPKYPDEINVIDLRQNNLLILNG